MTNSPASAARRVALVLGGSRGIGAAIVRRMARDGAAVAFTYAASADKGNEMVREIESQGGKALAIRADSADIAAVQAAVEETVATFGRLDILVNNAGITSDKTVLKMTDEDWYKVIAVNLSGAFFMSQAVLTHMLERGSGRIINISSLVGETGGIGQANYAASKSGLFGLTKTLAREACFQLARSGKLADDSVGITVNTVAPGYTVTEMLETVPEKVIERVKAQIPVGRLGRPDEIARVVHFLASDYSSFITGQVWGVNGGQDM
jgi:NAD(P)-dependent dehydrogenase (short-subunit alcohol dehydrogenase family)